MSYLSQSINSPQDLKQLPLEKLPEVCQGLRQEIIEIVSETGGHLGASLGAVELIAALHYVFDSPRDKFVWDVSHQIYAHKLITGRRSRMHTLRKHGGLSGFASPAESGHDHFVVGHASTAVSQALGLVCARDIQGGDEKIVAVIGDGSLTGGICYEALNNAGHLRKEMLIVLNDNEMSISKNVGAISRYLNQIITAPIYNRMRKQIEEQLNNFPRLKRLVKHAEEGFKNLMVPGIIFEELGFRYFGPIDGHDVEGLVKTLENIRSIKTPVLLHMLTKKGKGYAPAENHPERGHGMPPFDIKTGAPKSASRRPEEPRVVSYTKSFVTHLIEQAKKDSKIIAITAAMPEGTGLVEFQKQFPDRFFDVGIAEQHAVAFAGALARAGLTPVCAIYSTFLQRAFDQLIHDVTIQEVKVVIALDRAGVVGPDGPTHQGLYDIAYLSVIPNSIIASPWDEAEMSRMMELATQSDTKGIFAIRYPKENITLSGPNVHKIFQIGEGEIVVEGEALAILAMGSFVNRALEAAAILASQGISASVVNLRFAKPLDETLLTALSGRVSEWVIIEDHVYAGGLGARVLEFCERAKLEHVRVTRCAVPDQILQQGDRERIFDELGLSPEKIAETINMSHSCPGSESG
ncbi:MAG: 1-deoxy-D-xylulose-5-phosphate synthase, partial [Candidatus Omnitrophica bacterium]|nr:1-deoxy-D-xylulose-5-phosphate synthase [Candidatus Omnitrophota bacterium]